MIDWSRIDERQPLLKKGIPTLIVMFCLLLTIRGAFPLLVLGPVFKTGEGSGNRLLVGSIPMRSRHAWKPF